MRIQVQNALISNKKKTKKKRKKKQITNEKADVTIKNIIKVSESKVKSVFHSFFT